MSGPKRTTYTTFLATVLVFLTLSLVMYPEQGYQAGVAGMKVFWDVVFPSLLPFFILSELLLGIGLVHALGVLLEPLMRLLFGVPGVGAFALSMSLAAGYPMNAVIAAKFRKNKLCTRVESERLLAFTNTADPLFFIGALAVGLFHSPQLGMLLAAAHYIATLIVGVAFKFYGSGAKRGEVDSELSKPSRSRAQGNIFKRALSEMIRARQEDGRPIGKLLGDSVNDSLRTLFMICGFIIFFSVLIKVLTMIGVVSVLAIPFEWIFSMLSLDPSLVKPFIAGLFEIDIGISSAAQVSASVIEQLIIVSFLIGWSGLSVFAQVASIVSGTDIRLTPFVIARLLHGVLASILTLVLYNMGLGQTAQEVMAPIMPIWATVADPNTQHWGLSLVMLKNWFLLIGGTVALSLVYHFFKTARFVAWNSRSTKRR